MELVNSIKEIIRRDHLDNWFDVYPWLTGQLGNINSPVWFIGENPSLSGVKRVDRRSVDKTENLQWNSHNGDRLFREALSESGLKHGLPRSNEGWDCYITNAIKEPEIVSQRNKKKRDRNYLENQAKRWMPVLQEQIDIGRPKVLVALGGQAEKILKYMIKIGLKAPKIEKIHHYSYIMKRPEAGTRRGPGHPDRILEFKNSVKEIASNNYVNNSKYCIRQVKDIVREIDNPPEGPLWIRDTAENHYPFPISLDVGNGKVIDITPEIDRMLYSLSKSVMDTCFDANKSDFTDSEWGRMVKQAFGMALVNQDNELSMEEVAEVILKSVTGKLRDWIDNIPEREYVFGCYLCNVHDLEPLSMGPVRFEPRLAWLERTYGNSSLSKVSLLRIQRSWRGERLRERKGSRDAMCETKILDAIGKSDFVCSVAVSKMGSEAGSQKALTAARLATAVISLAWERPSSALDVITLPFDRQSYLQDYLVAIPGRPCGWQSSRSYISGGVTWLKKDDWAKLRTDFDEIFHCAGEVIKCFIYGKNSVSQPKILNALFRAILWFHEGCREQVDSIAIVKFCSSMEALADGNRVEGIQDLIKARLALKDEDKHLKRIKKIYTKGRSQTIHGKSDQLGQYGSNTRNYAESLARLCLRACLQWTVEYDGRDDPKCFSKLRMRLV